MKTRYWISTTGKKTYLLETVLLVPNPFLVMTYGIKECSVFTYWMFIVFGINLLKIKDKLKWRLN